MGFLSRRVNSTHPVWYITICNAIFSLYIFVQSTWPRSRWSPFDYYCAPRYVYTIIFSHTCIVYIISHSILLCLSSPQCADGQISGFFFFLLSLYQRFPKTVIQKKKNPFKYFINYNSFLGENVITTSIIYLIWSRVDCKNNNDIRFNVSLTIFYIFFGKFMLPPSTHLTQCCPWHFTQLIRVLLFHWQNIYPYYGLLLISNWSKSYRHFYCTL